MTERRADPGRWTAEGQRLKQAMDAQDRRQRASWARWDARLTEHERMISDLLRAEREQAAQVAVAEPVDAEPVAEPVSEPHAEPVPAPAEIIDAGDLVPGSPEHLRMREVLGIGRSSNHFI